MLTVPTRPDTLAFTVGTLLSLFVLSESVFDRYTTDSIGNPSVSYMLWAGIASMPQSRCAAVALSFDCYRMRIQVPDADSSFAAFQDCHDNVHPAARLLLFFWQVQKQPST